MFFQAIVRSVLLNNPVRIQVSMELEWLLSRWKSARMNYVYVLLSEKDGRFYTGSTNDLKRRLTEHGSGQVASTEDRVPLELVYYEACVRVEDARQRENYLKSGMGKRYLRNRLKHHLKDF